MSRTSFPVIRESAIAGTWYPGSAPALRRTIEGYLNQVKPVALGGAPLALVAPHAGYAYSGQVAAHAFAQARGQAYARVVLLGPLHRLVPGGRLGSFMIPAEAAYRTPLGDVPVDHAFLAALGERVPLTSVQGDEEHSLEIELPFLQVVLQEFRVAPIMLGDHIADPGAPARLARLAAALAELCDPATLIVASTDLTHAHSYTEVVRTDRALVDLVAAFDVDGLAEALRAGRVQACGATGLVAALQACQRLGARGVQVLNYASSGDITGNKRPGVYTVGYLAAVVYR